MTLPSPPARQPLWVPTPEMGVGRQVVRLGARGGLGLSEPASPSPNIEARVLGLHFIDGQTRA